MVVVASVSEAVVVVVVSVLLSFLESTALTEELEDLLFFEDDESAPPDVSVNRKIAPTANAVAIAMITAVIRTSDFFIENTP